MVPAFFFPGRIGTGFLCYDPRGKNMSTDNRLPIFSDAGSYLSTAKMEGSFPLSSAGRSAPLCVSREDYPGVIRVGELLQADIARVTDAEPALHRDEVPRAVDAVLIGTLGRSPLIDALVRENKLDASDLAGKREKFILQVIRNPMPEVDSALVIAGSDKRGTMYGMFDLSSRIGVSPWYWWADVPARKQRELHIRPGRFSLGEPAVTYRGIFINDEAPALSKWSLEKFGGFNHLFYEKVFELILRLKGNYLWPAMWGNAFHDDDPLNPAAADEFGIVIGTSHHEPMMRAHAEWARYGTGAWNYTENEKVLREFWEQGARGIGGREVTVTVGMRGDGDMPMTAETNTALLERIVRDQREILARVTGKDPAAIPQLWAIYKEVQDYYDRGMQVPEDITLLLCDDNWGNIRRLPEPGAQNRPGGYGIYYHFDYVGDPRNYKWLNTSPLPRTWEQMHLAYRSGVDRIWIVNVGDIKPLEFPIQFFLDYAWDPEAWPVERLAEYTRAWAAQQFGAEHAAEIARILSGYTHINGRRKPELLAPDTYSLLNYREAAAVVDEYNRLAEDAERVSQALAPEFRDAYYQLVLHPVKACANLHELYFTAGMNRLYAAQGRSETNDLAARVRLLYAAGRRVFPLLQRSPRRRQVEPYDGPDPHRLYHLAAAERKLHARSEGNQLAGRRGNGRGGRGFGEIGGRGRGRAGAARIRSVQRGIPLPRCVQPGQGSVRVQGRSRRTLADRRTRAGNARKGNPPVGPGGLGKSSGRNASCAGHDIGSAWKPGGCPGGCPQSRFAEEG